MYIKYLLSAFIAIIPIFSVYSQCPSKYIYSYNIRGNTTPTLESSVLCITSADVTSNYPNIRKATMPLHACLNKATFDLFNANIKMCSPGANFYSEAKNALKEVIDALNDVCANGSIDIRKEDDCAESFDGKFAIMLDGDGGYLIDPADRYSIQMSTYSWFPDSAPIQGIPRGIIAINGTKEYSNGDPQQKIPPKCWSSDCANFLVYDIGGVKHVCSDLTTLFMHEMCHALGLGHLYGLSNGTNKDGFGSPCNINDIFRDDQSDEHALDKETLANYGLYNYKNRSSISCYIGCALKKLYCPDEMGFMKFSSNNNCTPTSIEYIRPENAKMLVDCYPQPAGQNINLKIATNESTVTLSIYNIYGEEIYQQLLEGIEAQTNVSVQTNGMSAGNYYVVVKSRYWVASKIISIQK